MQSGSPDPAAGFRRFSERCEYRIDVPLPRRRANALNVEMGQPLSRCRVQIPAHWPKDHGSLRWLASGGDPTVFGCCGVRSCPLRLREPREHDGNYRAVRKLARWFLRGDIVHQLDVSAGNGTVIDWRSVKSGEVLVEGADAFDVATTFIGAVGTFAALDAIGQAPAFDGTAWREKKLQILHNRNPWVRP